MPSVTTHHRNIQLVAVEMFKIKNGLCPEIMKDLFHLRQGSNGNSKFIIPNVNSEYMGKLSLRYFGPVVWETMLPEVYKKIDVLSTYMTVGFVRSASFERNKIFRRLGG